ncbi:muscarinic acetylcholine receptor M4-like [Diadema antillarum]|uniref:muscarinic acetylcholine receptor M4-like n=1 Tax=Diadema antillarum TaxID=105358 RepID=UPI003A871FB7
MNNRSGDISAPGGIVLKATLEISWQAGVLFSISLITVIVNLVILQAFYCEKRLRTYNNYYIMNITIADLLVGLICMPIRGLMFAFDRTWILGQTFCYIFTGINQVLPGVSVFGTVIICFDRYLATAYPLLHYRKKSKKVAIVVNVLTWLIPLSIWMSLCTIWDLVSPNTRVASSGFCNPNYAEHVASVLVIIVLRAGIPFPVILLLSARIFYRAKSASRSRMVDHVSFVIKAGKEEKTVFKGSHHISRPRETEDKISTEVKTNEVKQNISSIYGQEIIARRQKDEVALTDEDTCGSVRARKTRPYPLLEGITAAKSQGEKRISDGSKALRTLAFLVVTFYLTWFLNTLNIILRTAAPEWSTSLPSAVQIRESGRWLSYCNSTLNPLAYTLAQPLLSYRVPMSMNICERNSVTSTPKPQPDPLLEGITTAQSQGEKRISDCSKALRTLAFLVVAFYLTWFLNTLNIILRSAAPAWFTSLVFEVQLRESGRWISYCNSTLNPLAYTLAQPLLRQTIRKMFCKKCQF